MKLIKKLTTILFAFMMVLAMTGVVLADDRPSQGSGVSPTDKGKLTINGALKNEEYKVYRIFDLESYDGNNYSYKVVNEWEDFFSATGEGKAYVTLDTDGYISSYTINNTNISDFVQKALKYVTTKPITAITADGTITVTDTRTAEADGTITYDKLPLGYYLVDSSVGALCSLNTTNLNATINEKNSVPTVEKTVGYSGGSVYSPSNTAEIGQVLSFQTTITVGDGAQNYILHDKMDLGLTYKDSTLNVYIKKTTDSGFTVLDSTKYDVSFTTADGDTFDIKFKQDFLDGLKVNDQIMVKYDATLNENAIIGSVGNKNKTWVSYGDKQTISNIPETITRTYGIPVFKFYKTDVTGTTSEQPLANVKFKLSTNATANLNTDADFIKFVKKTTGDEYRKAIGDETGSSTELVSNSLGKIAIQGLAAGTYYLYETETVKGYNKLTKPVQIEIKADGKIEYANKGETLQAVGTDGLVKVENKTGTILPSTGGVGTTMMYIVGAVLLIGSGVVLITKKNVK